MPHRSLLVVSALLTLFVVSVATAPVAAQRSRTPGISADADEDDDGGDEEIDSVTAHGNQKGEYGVGTDTDVDELIAAPAQKKQPVLRDVTDGLPEIKEDVQ